MNQWIHLGLTLSHFALALWASAHALIHHPQARGATLWVVVVWLIPWLGPLFYVVMGINRIPRRALPRAHVRRQALPEWRKGNRVTPLICGDEAYPSMIEEIEAAQTQVTLATYIFDNDRVGRHFKDALAGAVARGVEVRVLIDATGARYSRPPILKDLRAEGIKACVFLPTAMPWRWQYSNLRCHRKLMVVDGQVAFTGGMNIREMCLLSLNPDEPTNDVHFRVEGPVVQDIAHLFETDWSFATGESMRDDSVPPGELPGGAAARLVSSGPDHLDEPIRWLKLAAVVRARRRVRIVTPYFVPDEDVLTALLAAVSAGVHIQLILPAKNNLRLVGWASRASFARLLAHDVEIILSPPPFEHSKLMLVDDDIVIVGSANWDERSFRLNFEADLECIDASLSQRLNALIDERISGVAPLAMETLDGASTWSKLRDGIARLATPYI